MHNTGEFNRFGAVDNDVNKALAGEQAATPTSESGAEAEIAADETASDSETGEEGEAIDATDAETSDTNDADGDGHDDDTGQFVEGNQEGAD